MNIIYELWLLKFWILGFGSSVVLWIIEVLNSWFWVFSGTPLFLLNQFSLIVYFCHIRLSDLFLSLLSTKWFLLWESCGKIIFFLLILMRFYFNKNWIRKFMISSTSYKLLGKKIHDFFLKLQIVGLEVYGSTSLSLEPYSSTHLKFWILNSIWLYPVTEMNMHMF